MYKHEFCYWLQGYFELNQDYTELLNSKQIDCIKNHIALVKATEKSLCGFPAWLSGVLDSYKVFDHNNTATTKKLTVMIKEQLAKVFKHNIDTKYSNSSKIQDTLDKIHNDVNTTYRC